MGIFMIVMGFICMVGGAVVDVALRGMDKDDAE